MKLVILICGSFALSAFSAYGQASITKRWQAAGRLINGKLTPHKAKTTDYEFLSGGKFNLYENGSIIGSGNFTMASDKKSFVVQNGYQTLSASIIKLTSSELNFKFHGERDTIVCYAYGTAIGTKAQSKTKAYREARREGFELARAYRLRADYMKMVIEMIFIAEKTENAAFKPFADACGEMEKYRGQELADFTQAEYKQYQDIQEKIAKGFEELTVYIKEKHPDIKVDPYMEVAFDEKDKKPLSEEIAKYVARDEAAIKQHKAPFEKLFYQYAE